MQYAKNLGGKSQKSLVEHQIIKKDKENLIASFALFSTP